MQAFDSWFEEYYRNNGVDALINEIIKMRNSAPKSAVGTNAEIVRICWGILNGEEGAAERSLDIFTGIPEETSAKEILKKICMTIRNSGSFPISVNDIAEQAKKFSGLEIKLLYYATGILLLSDDLDGRGSEKQLAFIQRKLTKMGRNPVVSEVDVAELKTRYSKDPTELGMEFFSEHMSKSYTSTAAREFVDDFSRKYDQNDSSYLLREKWNIDALKNKVTSDYLDGQLGDDRDTIYQRQSDVAALTYANKKDDCAALLEIAGLCLKYKVSQTPEWFKDMARIGIYIILNCYKDVDVNPNYKKSLISDASMYLLGKTFFGIDSMKNV